MNVAQELRTDRLYLRRWCATDRRPFAALNADSRVMEHFPAPLSREESDALATRIENHFEHHGFGLWVVEILDITPFAGFIGLSIPRFEHILLHALKSDGAWLQSIGEMATQRRVHGQCSPSDLSNYVSLRSFRLLCPVTCARAG